MNKTEMLFIRACKSSDAVKRIKSIYKRFYVIRNENLDEMFEQNIVFILSSIVDDYYPMRFCEYLRSRGEHKLHCSLIKNWEYNDFDADLRAIVNHFRFMSSEVFKDIGVIVPIQFRRDDK